MSLRFAWFLTMLTIVAGFASPPVRAAGLTCPELAAVRLTTLEPAVARRIETRVRLAASRPRDNDVVRVVGMIRRADPSAAPSAINNYLVAVSCPIIAARTHGGATAQTKAMNAFAIRVQKAVY